MGALDHPGALAKSQTRICFGGLLKPWQNRRMNVLSPWHAPFIPQ
jgi:hypothetical protein